MRTWCLSNGDWLWRIESCSYRGGKWFVLKWHGDERCETGCEMSHIAALQSNAPPVQQHRMCNSRMGPTESEWQEPSSKHFLIWRHNVQTRTWIPNSNLTLSPVLTVCSCLCTPTENRSTPICKGKPSLHGLSQYCACSNLLCSHNLRAPQDHCVGTDLLLTNNLFVFAQKGKYKQCNQTPNWPAHRRKFARLFWFNP